MKKTITVLALFCMLSAAMAQEEPEAGITPDSRLYGLDRALERISLALTFDRAAKAEKRLQMASERIAELNEMTKQNRHEYTERLRKDYENEINETENDLGKARALGKNVTALAEHVANMTSKHITVLQRVLEKVPERARPAIEHAINVSQNGHERAVESILKEKGAAENKTKTQAGNKTKARVENETQKRADNGTGLGPGNVTQERKENKTRALVENKTKTQAENENRTRTENTTGTGAGSMPENAGKGGK